MNEATTTATLRDQILSLAERGEIQEIENAWLELSEKPPTESEFYVQLTKSFTKRHSLEPGHNLIVLLLNELSKRSDWKLVYRIVSSVASAWPQSDQLRGMAEKSLRNQHASNPQLDLMLAASKIRDGLPVDQAIKRFRSFLRLAPGQVFQHKTWGEGVVQSLDMVAAKIVIDFPTEKEKTVTFEGVKNFLTYLPPESFLARRAKDPEKLLELGEENPVALIRLALETWGGKMKQSNLKAMLVGSIIPAANWNSWWTKARRELRLDSMIDFDAKGGAHAELAIRQRPKSFEEEIYDLFFDPEADLAARITAVQKLADAQKSAASPDLLKRMLKFLMEEFRLAADRELTERIQIAYLAEQIKGLAPGLQNEAMAIPSPDYFMRTFTDYEALRNFDNADYAKRALKVMIERDKSVGIEAASKLFPKAPVKLAQAIWKEFDEEHHLDLGVRAMEKLFERPIENPETYYWAMKAIVDGGWEHLEDYFPLSGIVPELLDGLDDWQDIVSSPQGRKDSVAAAKQLLGKVRTLLLANHCAAICKAAEEMSLDQAQRLRRSIQTHPALNDPFKAAAERQLTLTRKDLETAPAAPSEPDFHYCTAKMRSEKLKELTELNSVLIPANSKEIEEARQEGDLKENAGYHAAKDKQKMLMQQTLQLQQAITSSRIFNSSMVRTDAIGFGTSFEADNLKTSEKESYTVLGRWEADPERHILSYLAPLVQQFMGKKPGEEIVIKHPGGGETPYRVTSISSALASGEWDIEEGKENK